MLMPSSLPCKEVRERAAEIGCQHRRISRGRYKEYEGIHQEGILSVFVHQQLVSPGHPKSLIAVP
jgi:hypothetical protein